MIWRSPERRHRLARRIGATLPKLVLSAGMAWWATARIDFSAMAARVDRAEWLWLVPLAILMIVQVALLCLRFRWVLAGVEGRERPVRTVARAVLAGLLFNQSLPANIGGDAARVALLVRVGVSLHAAFSAVVADRIAALAAMMLAMGATLPLLAVLTAELAAGLGATLLWTDLAAAVTALVALALLHSWPHLVRRNAFAARFANAVGAVRDGLFAAKRLDTILLSGVAGHLATALFAVCVAACLDVPLTTAAALVLVPPVLLVTQLPISIAGWGVREAAMVTALDFVGIPSAEALLISVGIGLAILLQGLVAGLVWSAGNSRVASREEQRGAPT